MKKEEDDSEQITSVNNVFAQNPTEQVILKTGDAFVRGKRGATKVNILFDKGSQRTFVSEEIVHRAGLRCDVSEKISITTFANEARVKKLRTVNFPLRTSDSDVSVRALVVPHLADSLCNLVNLRECKKLPHLRGVELAVVANRLSSN